MKTPLNALPALLMLALTACSSASFYEGTRQSARNECLTVPSNQYEECMQQYEESYDSYNKKRDEVLDDQ